MNKTVPTISQNSLDFLQFLYSDVFELIFQHLSFNDVISASLVNKQHFDITAASSSCMKKINVIADYTIVLHPEKSISKRSYQNILLQILQRFVISTRPNNRLSGIKLETNWIKRGHIQKQRICGIIQQCWVNDGGADIIRMYQSEKSRQPILWV